MLKVEDVRDVAPPTFEKSKPELQQIMMSEAYGAAVKAAREKLKVEVLDKTLALPKSE